MMQVLGFRSQQPKVVVPTGKCGADVTRVSIPVSRARAAIWITDGPGGFDPGLPSDPDYRPLWPFDPQYCTLP